MRASRCRFPVALSSLLLVTFLTAPADAFEYEEHRDVSNEGFARAQQFIRERYDGCPAATEVTDLKPRAEFFAELVSFGDLVALVDYVADPNDFVTPSESHSLNKDRIRKLNTVMRALHSAHNDTNHYQERALSSFWIWHRVAMREARGGDLRLALAYSAFSLHFLEDFLAPGHVRTPRPDLHDAAAMKIHDWFNGLGQIFKVRNLDDLRPPFLEPRVLRGLEGNPNLFLLGDERLGRPESNVLQAPFIAAVVGRAIADVFEGYLDGACPEGQRYSKIQVRNHFEGDWEWRTYDAQADEQKTLSPLACIHYGCYEQVLETHSFDFRPIFVAEAGAQALLSVDTTSRAQSELSVGAIWLLSPPKGWRTGVIKPPIQLLGGVEWNHVFGRAYADGIRARLYFPITALDLQLTASATYLWYGGDFSGDQRLGWDAGFQFGYGLLFAGINVGRQSVLNEMNDRLTPAWTLTGNVTVMLSPSIISKLLKPDRGVTFTH